MFKLVLVIVKGSTSKALQRRAACSYRELCTYMPLLIVVQVLVK